MDDHTCNTFIFLSSFYSLGVCLFGYIIPIGVCVFYHLDKKVKLSKAEVVANSGLGLAFTKASKIPEKQEQDNERVKKKPKKSK